tara:strand:- start:64 stop:1062 length:999 start_codon:yes stop_codon:yes gene_type:complete
MKLFKDKYKIILIKENQFALQEYSFSFLKLFSVISFLIFFILINIYFFSSDILNYFEFKEIEYHRSNNVQLLDVIDSQNNQIKNISKLLDSLKLQEEKFRRLVKLPSIHKEVRRLGVKYDKEQIQSLNDFEYLIPNKINYLSLIAKNIDDLHRMINLEMLSYSEILNKAQINIDRLVRYPAVHPVDFKTCKKTKWIKGKKITGDCYQSSLFGNRRHPVTLRWHHHDGDDYSANTGTPVFVTADGEVEKSQYSVTSGNYVLVNHGYGYKTYYGHLYKRSVKRGDKIERGDKVGEVGNTGRLTTAEHLHYEVQYNKQAKNPKDYFFDNSNDWAN